ncbi:MAG: hypothetical protein WBA74_07075 [Cyclobacteriaceae bacterium]
MIHKYFKKETEDFKILVQINPETYQGLELIVLPDNSVQKTKRSFDEEIYEDLEADEFEDCSPIEFNLNLKGIF